MINLFSVFTQLHSIRTKVHQHWPPWWLLVATAAAVVRLIELEYYSLAMMFFRFQKKCSLNSEMFINTHSHTHTYTHLHAHTHTQTRTICGQNAGSKMVKKIVMIWNKTTGSFVICQQMSVKCNLESKHSHALTNSCMHLPKSFGISSQWQTHILSHALKNSDAQARKYAHCERERQIKGRVGKWEIKEWEMGGKIRTEQVGERRGRKREREREREKKSEHKERERER